MWTRSFSLLVILGGTALASPTCVLSKGVTAPADTPTTVTTLNNGTAFVQGTVGDMIWQASGILDTNCTLSSITSCYHMSVTSNASAQLDTKFLSSPRQRDEWHFPQLDEGTAYSYTWKAYLYAGVSTSTTWFHMMQAFGVSEDNPLVTLDAVDGDLRIKDYVRGTGGPQCGAIKCPSVNLTEYEGRTTVHSISGSFGPQGTLVYNVTDEDGTSILSYSVASDMGAAGG
ncbi:hypothetical protein FB45DRAFT_1065596 [Roridomyces roridus]|uniref:Uncharacterized protein n=1 Tax=Roridomyces roridus TaxID=1738132 RepID=A0AAD7B6Q0_9AGAR|nr:hypothetical protein FB45DRAFT_1065596 [Roridomyces roridus]